MRYQRRGNETIIEELRLEIAEGSLDWGAIFALIAAIAAFTAGGVLIALPVHFLIAIGIWCIGFVASVSIIAFCIHAKVKTW